MQRHQHTLINNTYLSTVIALSQHEQGNKMHYKFWMEILKEKDHLEDLGIDGRIILKWKNWV
jgi:hypothetical protein